MSPTHVAFFRGINVGGKNVLPMKQLAAIFAEAGCSAVQTYVQSGNVVFAASPEQILSLPLRIAKAIEGAFAFDTFVVLRNASQMQEIIEGNPYLRKAASLKELHCLFLTGAPSPERLDILDPARSAPDEFTVRGQNIYLRLPNGAGKTKLTTSYFDSKLNLGSTARNWNTVTAVATLLQR